mmetsp:Transcript_79711/g.185072  ORF Transcript_79711/g.185072 Transcript_79711/m.185072 type:complete len:82 (-) Transcript_79711:1305-1550(-)
MSGQRRRAGKSQGAVAKRSESAQRDDAGRELGGHPTSPPFSQTYSIVAQLSAGDSVVLQPPVSPTKFDEQEAPHCGREQVR